ncbi:MAG TPA: histidine kinase dimerization/phospho-acceptor domain-containing protein, partial [Dehalococcoidia bacterium]|nr:histidine kinase dimerization/phospho-acceptor domain-containing protein [Dehalococcoidia bacterium]
MIVFDLRWILFVGLVLLLATGWGVVWAIRREAYRRRNVVIGGRVEGLLEQLPVGVVILHGTRAYHFANAAARRLLGLPARQGQLPEAIWSGQLASDRLAARETGAAVGRLQAVTLAPDPTNESPSDSSVEGARLLHWRVAALGDQDLVCLTDVTSQRLAEEAARSLVNDLSHEVRTPLATILTHVEVLSLPTVPSDVKQQSLQVLRAEVEHLLEQSDRPLGLGP